MDNSIYNIHKTKQFQMLNKYQHMNSLVNFISLNETMQPGAWYGVCANEIDFGKRRECVSIGKS